MSGSPAPISLYVPQVDALRGLGALSVAFVHSNMGNLLGKGELSAFQTTAYRAIDLFGSATNANSALILFFVISGFLIALMLDRQPAGASVASFLTFLWRRALRIYPAHLVALAIFVPLAAFTLFAAGPSSLPVDPAFAPVAPWMDGQVYGRLDRGEFVHTALLQNNYYNPPVWSLQVEVLACLF